MVRSARRSRAVARSPKRELLRKTVLEAASRLFAERGFGGTSLQDIADALGISRPALYYYFKSKEDILDSLVEEVTVFSEHQATALAASADFDPGETLRKMVYGHAKWLLEHPVEFRVVDRTESDLPLPTRRVHERAKRAVLDDFTRTIQRGIELGHFRAMDARIAAFSIIGMCSWTAWWFKTDGRLSAQDVAHAIADLATNGIRRGGDALPREYRIDDAVRRLKDDLALLEEMIAQDKV
jgi:AcrR family transcriptional regulator